MKLSFLLLFVLLVNILFSTVIEVAQGESIQSAIDSSSEGDVILLTGTFYSEGSMIHFYQTEDVTLRSDNTNPMDCIITGNLFNDSVIFIEECNRIYIENICIQDGNSFVDFHAGGITYSGSDQCHISNCIIESCSGISGSAILCNNSSLTIIGSTRIRNNSSLLSSFRFMNPDDNQTDLFLYNTIFEGNQDVFGVLYGDSDTGHTNLTIYECLFLDNVVSSNNGGIISWHGNDGASGYYEIFDFEKTTFTQNSGASCLMINESTYGNVDLDITNCIFWNQTSSEIPISEAFTTVSYSDVSGGYTGEGNLDEDPSFISQFDPHLTISSPCIDAGNPDSDGDGVLCNIDEDDQDPDGTRLDMGCYYYHHDDDIKIFEEGIQWVSFPMLTQQGTHNGDLFEQVYFDNGLPGLLQLTTQGLPEIIGFEEIVGYRNGNEVDIQYLNNAFIDNTGFDNMLFRQEGYKIDVEDGTNPTILEIDGELLTLFTLDMPSMQDFWLGYYIPYPQNIEDAFGKNASDPNENFWGNVNRVWAEDWYYDAHRIQRSYNPSQLSSNSTKGKTLEYGKMYIVEMYHNVYDFTWYGSSNVEVPVRKDASQNFEFTEKMAYEVIDIVDIPSDVQEIGVFEGEECVGAVTVEDSCELILVYSEYANREPIPFTFEIITGRGNALIITDYYVMNMETGEFELSIILSGRQDYSAVRFGEPEDQTYSYSIPILKENYPNPFNPTTTISFSLPDEQVIDLSIFNLKGQKVKTLYSGMMSNGEHSLKWDGRNDKDNYVSSGIYFYNLKSEGTSLTQKMIFMK